MAESKQNASRELSNIRKEMDSLGEVDVAADMLWGPQFTASKIDLPLTRLVHQSSALRRHERSSFSGYLRFTQELAANNRPSANRPLGPVPVSPFLRTIQLGSSRTLRRSAYLVCESMVSSYLRRSSTQL
jgi:hypothetical protein